MFLGPETVTSPNADAKKKETYQSFDAVVWAKDFVETVKKNPSIATDEETMTTWFAGALMRGYDEHYWRSREYKVMVRRVLVPWWRRIFTPLSSFGR